MADKNSDVVMETVLAVVTFLSATTILVFTFEDPYLFYVTAALCIVNAVLLLVNREKSFDLHSFDLGVLLMGFTGVVAFLLFAYHESMELLEEIFGFTVAYLPSTHVQLIAGVIFYSQSFLLPSLLLRRVKI